MFNFDDKLDNNFQLDSHLDELLTKINIVIADYLKMTNMNETVVPFQNPFNLRLHNFAGETGRKRALQYQQKINNCKTVEAVVKTIVADCGAAFEVAKQETLISKSVCGAKELYSMVSRKLSIFGMGGAVEEKTGAEFGAEVNLGNSELLRNHLIYILFEHFSLTLTDYQFLMKMQAADSDAADRYRINQPFRQYLRLKEYVVNTWPASDEQYYCRLSS